MQSNKSLAIWASQTYSQTGGVNNWTQYQLSLLGTSNKFNVYSAGSSSTVLSIYDAYNFYGTAANAGDTMLLSTNGTSFTSGTLGARTITAPPMTITSGAFTTTSIYVGQSPYYFVKPDGTKFWQQNGSGLVYEFNVATPYDLSTATRTSRTFSLTSGKPFCFSADGTTLFTYSGTVINSYALGTAWDITTISANPNGTCTITIPTTTNWNAGSSNISSMRFSPDGTKLLLQNGATTFGNASGNWALWTLSVPWVLGSLVSATTTNATTYNYSQGTYTFSAGSEFAPDGRSMFVSEGLYGSPSCSSSQIYFFATTFGTAWNLTTWANPAGAGNYAFSATQSNQQSNYGVMCFNETGTFVSYIGYNNGSISYVRKWTCDYWNKYNFNISGYSLGATPTAAYYAAPTVGVDAETTAARINMFNYDLYMASSSTTQAVVYLPAGGVIAANDNLLLNGATTVTTSAVTQGSVGAVAAVPIYTASNRYYTGKSIGVMSSSYSYAYRISPDGSRLIVSLPTGTYGAGLYAYNLTTPFDISTAVFANQYIQLTTDQGGNNAFPFDISPDGTRLITLGCYVTGSTTSQTTMYAREYSMSQPWNIGTLNYTGNTWNTAYSNSSWTPTCIQFTPNGGQVVITLNNGSYCGSSGIIGYSNCGTPYRIGTAGSGITLYYNGVSGINGTAFTPDGLNIITFYGTSVTTSNTLGTANNMATATTTNNIQSATNKWSWPSGTVTPTTNGCLTGTFSPDGTKFYCMYSNSTIWEMGVMVIPQTSYTCTFPTQGSAPTSVTLPDRSVSQTITTTLSSGVMTFAASAVATNARGIALKITSPQINTSITNATLSMWRS